MKTIFVTTAVFVAAFLLSSCEEEKKPAYVVGGFECSQCQDINFDGKLAKSGADLYGYCEEKDGVFEFEVGDDDQAHVSGATQGYISVRGISGPPQAGVFDLPKEPKEGEEYYEEFTGAVLKNSNTYNIGSSDEDDDNNLCRVELFAEAAEGELIPTSNEPFEYYVRINCQGMDVGEPPITFFRAEFYFDGCK